MSPRSSWERAPARRAGRFLRIGFASALAAILVWPAEVEAFNFLGSSLDLGQRDFRVFNNFTDPSANDNTVPDPDFPGAIGAPLAIWKGAVEWSSERHGTGYGDPHQPGTLGSGGANFDPVWQGLAASAGGPDDNIVSELAGGGGGVFAFMDAASSSDGWRIRFYQWPAILHDGPGRFPDLPSHMDIQGIFAHEYGHALGLAHTNDAAATMFASADPTTILSFRSIGLDDIAGVQALYGVRAATKPHIDTYSLSAGVITLSGANFSLAGNEVWFTNGAAGADGTPLKVAGVASANGTSIQVAIPLGAIAGDVLVKSAGDGGAVLSNPFPFDPAVEPCFVPRAYGSPKLTSIGTSPHVGALGRPRLSTQDLEIEVSGGIPHARGFVYYGLAPDATPFFGGTRLVAEPHVRLGRFLFDADGRARVRVPIDAPMIGTTRYYQALFHDAGDAFGIGISDAVEIRFCP